MLVFNGWVSARVEILITILATGRVLVVSPRQISPTVRVVPFQHVTYARGGHTVRRNSEVEYDTVVRTMVFTPDF